MPTMPQSQEYSQSQCFVVSIIDMFRTLKSIPLRQFMQQSATGKSFSTHLSTTIRSPTAGTMKAKIFQSLQIGTLLLIMFSPSSTFCAEGKMTDNKRDASFADWLKNVNDNGGINFENLNDILSKSFEPGGPMVPVKELFESGVAGKVGYGFMMGYSSGFCIKKVSKFVAFFVGAAFIMIQTLQQNGFIDVKYDKVEKEVTRVLDLNKDGALDGKDLKFAHDKVQEVLGYHMPAGGGFATGLVMGLRS